MTTDLKSSNLLDLLPENLKSDIQSICFSKAVDKIFEKAIESTSKIRFF